MSSLIVRHAIAVMFLSLSGTIAFGQTDSLVLSSGIVPPGGTVSLNLSLSSTGGVPPAGLEWTLVYSPSNIVSISALPGTSATNSSKGLACAPSPGSYLCVVTGINPNTIPAGVVAVVTVTVAPGTTGTSIGVANAIGASLAGNAIPIVATGGSITVVYPFSVAQLVCNPATVNSGAASACTVTLNQAAVAGGTTVTLTSNNPALTVPAAITVPAGASSANFTATAGTITASQSASVTASLSGSTQTAVLNLLAPMLVTALTCNPATVNSSSTSTCTATLNQPSPAGGSTVGLTSNNAALTVASSVTVPAGASSANFTANVGTITTNQTASLTASLNGSTQTTTLNLVSPMTVTTLTCNPATVNSGSTSTCTATLNQPSPAGGSTVALTSNNAALTVPAAIAVPAGASSANFTATAGTITTNQTASITASLNGSTQSFTLSLAVPITITRLSCNPTLLNAGAASSCTATFSAVASAGLTISISAGSPALVVPSSVTLPAASSTAAFQVSAATVAPPSEESVVLTASVNNTSQSVSFTIMCPCSIWSSSAQPVNPASTSKQAIEVGMKFTSSVAGYATGVRFFKGATNTGTHIGSLWSSTGTRLAKVTFSNETASGWQTAYFPSPVAISPGTVYVISYHAPKGHTAADNGYFTNSGVNNAPLQAPADSHSAPDGIYINGNGAFPCNEASATNYWVDVIFNLTSTVGTGAVVSFWKPSNIPGTPSAPGTTAAELGMEFTPTTDGYVTGIRFYKSHANVGTHVGYLWTSTGTLLGTVTFTNESINSWQQANFDSPIAVTANAVYVISYWAPKGNYANDVAYFATKGATNSVLYAPIDGQYGANGAFASSQAFPQASSQSSNYWVDVVFTTSLQ